MSSATNPLTGYQETLRDLIYLEGGQDFQDWLTGFEILLAVSGTMVLISLTIRLRKDDVWLFHVTSGGFILPHFVFCALFFSLLFIITDFIYIEFTRGYGIVGTNMKGAMFFRCVVWYPSAIISLALVGTILTNACSVWLGGWTLSWTSTLQPLVTPQPPSSSFDLSRHPNAVNTFFITIPILFVASLTTLAGICESHWSAVFDLYLVLDKALIAAVADFENGRIPPLVKLLALQEAITKESLAMILWLRLAMSMLTLFVTILIVVFSLGSYTYFKDLARKLRSIRRLQGGGGDFVNQINSLRSAYNALRLTTIVVLALEIAYFIISIVFIVKAPLFITTPRLGQNITLAAIAIYVFFGLGINCALLIRSINLPPKKLPRSPSQTTNLSATLISMSSLPDDHWKGGRGGLQEGSDRDRYPSLNFVLESPSSSNYREGSIFRPM